MVKHIVCEVRVLNEVAASGTCLCLVGPMGVGNRLPKEEVCVSTFVYMCMSMCV